MAMREQQERRSPPVETTHTASDEPELVPKSGPTAGGAAATAGDMAGSGAAGEEERGPEGAGLGLDIVGSPSAWSALLSAAGSTNQVEISSILAGPWFQRRPRTHVPRAAAPSPHWLGFRLPVLPVPPAPPAKRKGGRAKKPRDTPCALCGAAETPLWRTWPTDWRVPLCNACGIQVRTLPPGAVLPELVYLPHPATATAVAELEQPVVAPAQETQQPAALPKQVRVNLTSPAMAATTVVVPELEPPRPQEIQEPEPEPESPPDSPILESLLDADIYLVKRTSPRRREKSPSPPPPPPTAAEPEPDAGAPAPGNENAKQPERRCLHCGATSTRQWRLGPEGEKTLCNPCGVRYRQGGLVPEYRPRESPSFTASVHSNERRAVLQIRRNLAHPAPPPAYQPVRARRKRRRGDGEGQQQRVQVGKKRKEEEQYQPAAAVALPVREKSKRIKAMEQRRQQPPQPEAAATQLRAGNDMLLNLDLDLNLPPPLPPALPNAGGGMEVDGHLPPELPQHTAGNMEMEEQDLPPPSSSPPLALPLAGGERMRDEEGPMPAPEPFLFDGPAAPIIVDDDDDEPVEVIVIDDD